MPPHACEGRAASGRCCAGERPAEDGVNSRRPKHYGCPYKQRVA